MNRDEYVRPGPYERAQTWKILVEIGAVTAEEVRYLERFVISSNTPTNAGALT